MNPCAIQEMRFERLRRLVLCNRAFK